MESALGCREWKDFNDECEARDWLKIFIRVNGQETPEQCLRKFLSHGLHSGATMLVTAYK